MNKQVKVALMVSGLLLLAGTTYAAIKYKREKGKFDLKDFLKNLPKPKPKVTVIADNPIKITEEDYYGYKNGQPDWMPEH